MTLPPSEVTPGWYGKLPSLGDFASRRLPPDFVLPWDAWLQAVVQFTRAQLGEGWLDRYLTTPIWRFVLLPGLVGPTGWAGVLMPSVDRVGRYFPLTVAVPLPTRTAVAHAVFAGADWFDAVEETTLGALDPLRDVEELDRVLAAHTFAWPAAGETETPAGPVRRLPAAEAFTAVAQAEALDAWSLQAGWKALWWTRGRVDGDALALACASLPTGQEFGWLLESRASPSPGRGAAAGARA